MSSVWHISAAGMTIRLLLALVLGGAIGFERGWKHRTAGFRTHILVCVGATMLMLLSIYGFGNLETADANHPVDPNAEPNLLADPARLVAQVISGMGFLGAGVILQKGKSVIGLTTAASVWVVAGLGLCIGAGFYYCAIVLTVVILLVQLLLSKLEKQAWWVRGRKTSEMDTPETNP